MATEFKVLRSDFGWAANRYFHICTLLAISVSLAGSQAFAQNRYATSDNHSGYVHWIDLYDASNSRIDPNAENPKPYSPARTCGRCHDFDSISHGWHFDAVDSDAVHGRPGQPWIWSDARTGTHLPLSYRDWEGTYNPDALGLSRWQVAAKLGGYLPGGGVGSESSLAMKPDVDADTESVSGELSEDRTKVTGELPVDCMICHRNTGSGYSPFVWTEQIEDENFAYAPSAALGIATVSGNMTRLKDDFDPTAEDAASKLPKLTYESSKFRSDGKVFFDLVRKPKNDSCYYCHTNAPANAVMGGRWLHDEDVHVRAGIACADCHRNSLDHQTVRGFEGEQHPSGQLAAAFSCQGCHVGNESGHLEADLAAHAGRLGAPMPAHRGLPPVHFEKMTCTACHSGPSPSSQMQRQINSIAHRLGEHVKRTGEELPGIMAGINIPLQSYETASHDAASAEDEDAVVHTKLAPHRMMWPSYWGVVRDGNVTPLNPEVAYELIRKPLKMRKPFVEELSEVKLSLPRRKEILGDERARVKEEERTEEEQAKLNEAEAAEREQQTNERVSAALAAIEAEFADEEHPELQAVFVTGGAGYVRKGEDAIELIDPDMLGDAADPYAWPIAHNVRPATQSLGATGCLECHSENSDYFNTEVVPVAVLPGQETVAFKASDLQGIDTMRLSTWNQLFAGRSSFKIAGLIALGLTCLVTIAAMAMNLSQFWRNR